MVGLERPVYYLQCSWRRAWSHDADCHVSLCHSFFPIGDNITMLTTADWLLGSNSQSTAGLSTLSDTMKGQYLVFSPTQMNAFYAVDSF